MGLARVNRGRESLMPLTCQGQHDFTDPHYERRQLDVPTRFPLTRLRLIRRCCQCDYVEEVSPEPVKPNRVVRYE